MICSCAFAATAAAALATVGAVATAPTALAASTSAASSPAAGTSSDDVNGCPAGHLPGVIEGTPASYHPGASRGAWIWHGRGGYSIRVTHPLDRGLVEFTGSVTADEPIRVSAVQLESNDHYWFSADRHTLYFAFANAGHTDGIDFTAACAAKVTFDVRANGAELSPASVHLGKEATPATSDPFTVERR